MGAKPSIGTWSASHMWSVVPHQGGIPHPATRHGGQGALSHSLAGPEIQKAANTKLTILVRRPAARETLPVPVSAPGTTEHVPILSDTFSMPCAATQKCAPPGAAGDPHAEMGPTICRGSDLPDTPPKTPFPVNASFQRDSSLARADVGLGFPSTMARRRLRNRNLGAYLKIRYTLHCCVWGPRSGLPEVDVWLAMKTPWHRET